MQASSNVTPLPSAPAMGMATVTAVEADGGLVLAGRAGVARRAASCLLQPAPGDQVWVVGESGQPYVIAVLERATEAPAVLSVPGNAALRAEGTLTVGGQTGLQLHTPEQLDVTAGQLQVQAGRGRAVFSDLTVLARSVFASLDKVTRIGKVLELLVDRFTQRSAHSVRSIEGLDRTEAQTIDLRAEGEAHVQATHALVNGKNLVKMDGGQIHLG